MLAALAGTADPDAAFAQFDRFLTNLPAGVQLFSLLLAHSELLRLIARHHGLGAAAGRSSRPLARHAWTRCSIADFLGALPTRAALDAQLANLLARAEQLRSACSMRARRFAKEQMFRVGVQVIEGIANPDAAGPAFADIAESTISHLVPQVMEAMGGRVGRVPGAAFAVIAMGKLGGREMTVGQRSRSGFRLRRAAGHRGLRRQTAACPPASISRGWRSG